MLPDVPAATNFRKLKRMDNSIGEEPNKKAVFSKCRRPQILATFTASIGIFTHGVISSWSSTAVPSIMKEDLFSDLTLMEQSWIISLAPFAAFLSAPIAGLSVDHYGRKMTMIVQALLLIAGFSTTIFANRVESLYIGRLMTGVSMGASVFAPVVYISDIAERDIRGTLNSCGQIMPALGILFSFMVGSVVSWRWQSLYSLIPALLYLTLLLIVPESPRFLLSKNKLERAFDSLCWLRGTESCDDVRDEISLIQANLIDPKKEEIPWITRLASPNVFRPMAISVGLMIFQQCIGFPSILYFSVTIFAAAGTLIDPHLSTVIIGFILVLTVGISSIFIDSTGRRPLLLISSIGSTLPLLLLGVYFYWKPRIIRGDEGYWFLESIEWIPLILVLGFVATYASGWYNVPWLIMTEIVPNNVVGIASGLGASIHFFFSFVITKYFTELTGNFGMAWAFFVFGMLGILATIFVYFCVPETKMKTLEEIQLYLNEAIDSTKAYYKNSSPNVGEYRTFD